MSIRSDNSSFDQPMTMMSSMYAAAPTTPVSIVSMICWKIAGAVFTPNGNHRYWNRLRRMFIVSISLEVAETSTCK